MKKSIYASVIASVIVIVFIQPILRMLGRSLLWLGANVNEGISKSVYREASLGLTEKFSFIVLFIILTSLFCFVIGMVVASSLSEGLRKKLKEFVSEKYKYLLLSFAFVTALDCVYLITATFAIYQLNVSFNQRLAVLAPQISDVEFKQFNASWASMENRKDYEAIVHNMERLAKDRDIKLPKPFWK